MTDKETIHCDHCDLTMWDIEPCHDEMELHEAECDGRDDPRERFVVGDKVEYSDFGMKRLDREQRSGEIAGFSRKEDHCVRVRWDGNKTATRYAHSFIRHEGG